MKTFKLTKSSMIDFLVTSLGYSDSDFYGLDFEEIKDFFEPEQLSDCVEDHTGY